MTSWSNNLGFLWERCLVVAIFVAAFQISNLNGAAQCRLIDNSRDAVFVTFEKTTKIKSDARNIDDGVVLRLHNNSTCSIIITAGSAEQFLKPLPENPTAAQLINREVEYQLSDGAFVPEVRYSYDGVRGTMTSVGGDSFFGFELLGARSILFKVPLNHFNRSPGSKIILIFQYAWEQKSRAMHNYPSVENTVTFRSGELPEGLRSIIPKD